MYIVQLRVRKTIYNGVGQPWRWATVPGFKYKHYDDAVAGAERMGVQQYLGDIARIVRV